MNIGIMANSIGVINKLTDIITGRFTDTIKDAATQATDVKNGIGNRPHVKPNTMLNVNCSIDRFLVKINLILFLTNSIV